MPALPEGQPYWTGQPQWVAPTREQIVGFAVPVREPKKKDCFPVVAMTKKWHGYASNLLEIKGAL